MSLYWSFPTGIIALKQNKTTTFLTLTSPMSSLPFIAKPTDSYQCSLSLLFLLSSPPLKMTFSISITLLSLNPVVPVLSVTLDRKDCHFHLYAFSSWFPPPPTASVPIPSQILQPAYLPPCCLLMPMCSSIQSSGSFFSPSIFNPWIISSWLYMLVNPTFTALALNYTTVL